jgi:acyl-CoA synthetase (NDP forming)
VTPSRGRDLGALFTPTSVAVVGASSDPSKWGNWLAAHALRGRHRRPVYLVNQRGEEVLGERTYPSLADLPGPVDLAVVAVPASAFEQATNDALAAGARMIVGISAGLGEAGADGLARQRALVERVRAAGAALLGPNCLGVMDVGAELHLTSDDLPAGSVGLISQSGNLALELGLLLGRGGMGYSRFASLGNQADVDVSDLVAAYADHAATAVIAVYCEDFKDGRRFTAAAAAAARRGKPVVLLAVGASRAAQRGARSHTGSLTSDSAVVDAACDAAGAVRVASPAQMATVAQALAQPRRPRGRRVAVFADGGGHGSVAADLLEAAGLEVPAFGPAFQARLGAELPPGAAVGNPIDLAGAGERDIASFDRVLRVLADLAGEIDAVLVTGYFGGYGGYSPTLAADELKVAAAMTRTVADAAIPVVIHTMHAAREAPGVLRSGGIPVYPTVDEAVLALTALSRHGGVTSARPDRGALLGSGAVGGLDSSSGAASGAAPAGPPWLPAPEPPLRDDGYWAARELLQRHGVPFVGGAPAASLDEALVVAAEIGYPVVLKALGLNHKSDAGGVALDLSGPEHLAAAVRDLRARLDPPGFSVERMADTSGGAELLAGARWDPRFGPVVLIGLGGVHAELFHDVALALAPVSPAQARALLGSLRGAAILGGARRRPMLDLEAACAAVAALSRAAAAHPEIREIEVNPLLVRPAGHGALGLDSRVVLRPSDPDRGPDPPDQPEHHQQEQPWISVTPHGSPS